MKTIGIIGASGYIGTSLITELLKNPEYKILALSRSAESIKINHPNLEKHNLSVFDDNLIEYLKNCTDIYYLVHMMGQKQLDYALAETKAAEKLNQSLKNTNLDKLIYLGGLGRDSDSLSKHLASRHKTGEILRQNKCQVIEFRASMVIGKGSISYDIIVNLVSKLPFLTLPRWSETLTQPIGKEDTINYLISALNLKSSKNEIIEIGGPDVLSYADLMRDYAKWKGLKRLFIRLPIIPTPVSAWWLNLFTPKNEAKVGRAMIESLQNQMTVTNSRAQELFPDIKPKKITDCFV
jgi:uncharacterized protein YbjT (DUF2867 family)